MGWRSFLRVLVAVGVCGIGVSALPAAAGAATPTVTVSPAGGVSWGDTLTVTTAGYPVQESAYLTLCNWGTAGRTLTIKQVTKACTGEIEHRLDSGFNPSTNYGYINGANGSDTVVLTDGRPSSQHCATGRCDLVVLEHNCIDQLSQSATCTYLGRPIVFASIVKSTTVLGKNAHAHFKPAKLAVRWTQPPGETTCTAAYKSFTVTNASPQPQQLVLNGSPLGAPIATGDSTFVCLAGSGKATILVGIQGTGNVLTLTVR